MYANPKSLKTRRYCQVVRTFCSLESNWQKYTVNKMNLSYVTFLNWISLFHCSTTRATFSYIRLYVKMSKMSYYLKRWIKAWHPLGLLEPHLFVWNLQRLLWDISVGSHGDLRRHAPAWGGTSFDTGQKKPPFTPLFTVRPWRSLWTKKASLCQ